MFLQGNLYPDNHTYFELVIYRWYEGNWKDDSTINTAISSAYLQLALVNTYFDFEDYANPVHSFLDDRFIFDTRIWKRKHCLYIRENESEIEEKIVRYSDDAVTDSFIEVERIDSRLSSENKNGNLRTIRLVKDPKLMFMKDMFIKYCNYLEILEGLMRFLKRWASLLLAFLLKDYLCIR